MGSKLMKSAQNTLNLPTRSQDSVNGVPLKRMGAPLAHVPVYKGDNDSERFTITIPKWMYDKLDVIAKAEGKRAPAAIRDILSWWLYDRTLINNGLVPEPSCAYRDLDGAYYITV